MNKPKVRFKGFSEEWEEKKLKDLSQFSKGSGYSKSDIKNSGTPLILYGRLYTKYETVIENIDTFAEPKPGSVYSKGGEVIVPASGEKTEDISIASVVKNAGVLLGGDLNIIKPSEDLDSVFLAISISNGKPHKAMSQKAQGKTVVHLHNSDIEMIDLSYPLYDEQCKISGYFSKFDTLIILTQQKLTKLQTFKKSMLAKMFPKPGVKVPEVRFKGFSGDWEEKKLGDIGKVITGSTPSTNITDYYSSDGIPWVTPTDIENQTISNTERKLSEKGVLVARIVPANTILCTCIASIGKNTLLTVKGSFNQQINGLIPNDDNDAYFLLTESEIWSNYMKSIASSGIMQIVNKKEFSELYTMIPTIEEQQKIGNYFSKLDTLITLTQQKITKLKKFKKSMLNKMFI